MDTADLRDDLAFLRRAVRRRDDQPAPAAIRWLWAAYVLVGYAWLDIDYRGGGLFLLIAGLACGVASWLIGAAAARRQGERDRAEGRAQGLHWLGALLGVAALVGLAAIHPPLRSSLGGQLIVVVIAIVYWTYGVHRDRHFLWLAVVMLAGAVAVSFVPSRPWTWLGIVIAAGLVAPTLFARRSIARDGDAEAQS